MSPLAKHFPNALAALNPAQTLVAAVSGGADSMVLLDLLAKQRRNLVVAHFNHQLRGAESNGDEEFVRVAATKRGLIFRAGRGDVLGAARGISMEMAARNLRHAFLAGVAREFTADVVLAHHADDQIELFLLRLLRGIEGPGLGGMQPVAPSAADAGVRLLRPLLTFSRAQILAHVEKAGVAFREDTSNAELKAERNRIRHLVIPPLRAEAGERFHEVWGRHLESVRAKNEIARAAAKAWLTEARVFAELPEALRIEVIAVQLEESSLPVTGKLISELLKNPGARVSIDPDSTVSIDGAGKLQILGPLWPKDSLAVDLCKGQSAVFGGLEIRWRSAEVADLKARAQALVFDADRVGTKVVLRHWQPGDAIRLSGRASIRPLHEMFSRNKIPRAQRHRVIVAAHADGRIFWVEGLRITEDFKVTAGTRRFMEWRWRRE